MAAARRSEGATHTPRGSDRGDWSSHRSHKRINGGFKKIMLIKKKGNMKRLEVDYSTIYKVSSREQEVEATAAVGSASDGWME